MNDITHVRAVYAHAKGVGGHHPAQLARNEVLLHIASLLAIEAGVTYGWDKYVGPKGDVLGLDRFGASAPYKVLMKEFGFTAEAVAERVLQLLK